MDDDIKALLEKNLKVAEETQAMVKKIKNYMAMQKIVSLIYFLIIVIPIVLSIIYLPPLLKDYAGQYQDLLDSGAGMIDPGGLDLKNFDLNKITPELLKNLQEN
jgi:hypothetical protein